MQIKQVPVFNEFDIWKPYRGEPIKSLNLYIVKSNQPCHMFLNKHHNLCYGQFLTQDVYIVAVTQPSFVKKVNYQQVVDYLWKTQISDDAEEDMLIKKRIANCNYGMMEKGVNRNQSSYIFDSYSEAKFYQIQYGGVINYIRQYEDVPIYRTSSDGEPMIVGKEFKETDKVIYILNLSATACLNNGFRYIKELLVQIHNNYLQECLQLLKDANIPVYSVKTDAFTIQSDSSRAGGIYNQLRGWYRQLEDQQDRGYQVSLRDAQAQSYSSNTHQGLRGE